MEAIRAQKNKTSWAICVGFIGIVYLGTVFWYAFSVTQRRIDEVLPVPYGTPLAKCEYLKKYHLREVPVGDANAWLFQDYLTLTFDKRILDDPDCLGNLISDIASTMKARSYRREVVIRIFDNSHKLVVHRIVLLTGN